MQTNTESSSELDIKFLEELEAETELNQWEKPLPFEKKIQYPTFPVESLPKTLSEYLKAVCDYVQVSPDLAALPMLSVLSLCLQNKAVISHPANEHTESLNIYTLTIAPPGERKSAALNAVIRPVNEYVRRYNELHFREIEEYRNKRSFLERQKNAAMNSKKADFERVRELSDELCSLKPVHELRLTCSDTTPEALAAEMMLQGGCMAVMDDEGSVFDVISGIYSGSQANINLLLKAYDGSSHTILRRTGEPIVLNSPMLTMGIMTQPHQFEQAIKNPQFNGRGLMQRFLFAFPEGRAGRQSFTSKDIPQNISKAYDELITNLLRMPKANNSVILRHDKESRCIFEDYHNLLQNKMQEGKMFENMKGYASKQFGKVMKITGLLHLCEHSANEIISGDTAMKAFQIGLWSENMILKACECGADEDELIRNAKYVLKRIKETGAKAITQRELKRKCKSIHDDALFDKVTDLLEDMNYIRGELIKTAGRPSLLFSINPFI